MSVPGTGYRTANSIACEISFHLCQPIVYTTLTNPITASALVQPATIASTNSLYTGAQVIVDSGVNVEVVTVVLVTSPTVFTAIFTLNHLAGIVIQSATFPLQALTDPIFTQLEILSYIARAQNEFLSQVPCVFSFIATPQNVSIGQLYQPAPRTPFRCYGCRRRACRLRSRLSPALATQWMGSASTRTVWRLVRSSQSTTHPQSRLRACSRW